jgi:hypothetical protein
MKRKTYIVKEGKMSYDTPEELENKLNSDILQGYEFERIIPSGNSDTGFYVYKNNPNLLQTDIFMENVTKECTESTYLTVDQLKLISESGQYECECNTYEADVTIHYDIDTEEISATVTAYLDERV